MDRGGSDDFLAPILEPRISRKRYIWDGKSANKVVKDFAFSTVLTFFSFQRNICYKWVFITNHTLVYKDSLQFKITARY